MFKTQKKFFAAAQSGNIPVLMDYLAAGHDWTNATDGKGDTALHHAARAGQIDTLHYLLDKLPSLAGQVNHARRPPLVVALMAGQDQAAIMLAADKSAARLVNTADNSKVSVLQHAIRHDNAAVLKLLLETGKADLNYNGPAVFVAATCRAEKCIDTLLAFNANPNVPFVRQSTSTWSWNEDIRLSALNAAAELNDTGIVRKLLAAGAKPEEKELPLALAAKHGNLEMAEALLLHGININARDKTYCTALHAAAKAGQADMVRFLLANGADKKLSDFNKQTALHLAQQFAMKDIADLLQENIDAPKAPPLVVKIAAAPTKPVAVPPAEKNADADTATWQRAGEHGVAKTETFSALNRRLTQIFNFQTRERMTITENLATRVEAIGPAEPFDSLQETPLAEALRQFQSLGGKVSSAEVLKPQLPKPKYRTS